MKNDPKAAPCCCQRTVIYGYTTLPLLAAIKIKHEVLCPYQEKGFDFIAMRCFPLFETFLVDTVKCKVQVVPPGSRTFVKPEFTDNQPTGEL